MNAFKTTALALTASTALAGGASAELILTGIIDGGLSGGTPKAIELYSLGTTDLSTYTIQNFNNGSTTVGTTLALSGTAADGEFLYVSSEVPNFTSYFGFAPDFTTNALNVNGDDVVQVSNAGAVVDQYGVVGVDGTGEAWEYLDAWAYREDATGPNGGVFDVTEYTVAAVDTTDGTTTAAGAGFPVGSYVAIPEPASLALVALGGAALLGRRRSA